MSKFRDRCHCFGRGLYVSGIGAGIGLVVFFAAYLWTFATQGPLTAMAWFKPQYSNLAVLQSFVFVTTAGILGRQNASIRRVVVGSCLGLLITQFSIPMLAKSSRHLNVKLLKNPLFEMDMVWWIFALNVVAIAVSYASAPRRLECSRTAHEEENLAR